MSANKLIVVLWDGMDDGPSVDLFRTREGAIDSVRDILLETYDDEEVEQRIGKLRSAGWCAGCRGITATIREQTVRE